MLQRQRQPPQRVNASSSLQQAVPSLQASLPRLALCVPFSFGSLPLGEREGGKGASHAFVNNKPLCSCSLMRPLVPQILEQQGLVAASHLPSQHAAQSDTWLQATRGP